VRSRPEAMFLVVLTLLLWAAHSLSASAQGEAIDVRPGSPVVAKALETVMADPNLATREKTRILKWRGSGAPSSDAPAWMQLTALIARWIAESSRLLIWTAAIIGALLLAFYLLRSSRTRAREDIEELSSLTPTHVRELDIRPDTLPHDIGAAAEAAWEKGDCRAAVSLLYRGLLSRLVHRYRVPIRDSSTEGDCLRLASAKAPARPAEYASDVVEVWQRFVYGHLSLEDEHVRRLCAEFGPSLDGQSCGSSLGANGAA